MVIKYRSKPPKYYYEPALSTDHDAHITAYASQLTTTDMVLPISPPTKHTPETHPSMEEPTTPALPLAGHTLRVMPTPGYKGRIKRKPTTVRLDPALKERLEGISVKTGVSLNSIIELAVLGYMQDDGKLLFEALVEQFKKDFFTGGTK